MNQVAKLVMIDPHDNYLLLYRNKHPRFGNDPDLPGGAVEDGETLLEAMLREVQEEAGVVIKEDTAQLVYSGDDYSKHNTYYALYVTNVQPRPNITISWEHSSYVWLSREGFLERAKNAEDTYMHMAYDRLK